MRNINNKNKNKAPLLMTSHGQTFEKQSFYSLTEKRYHTTCLPIFSGKRVLASAYGWLVLVDYATVYADCFLWNPETREKIQLPLLRKPFLYNKCVLSKPPNEPDCLVVFNYSLHLVQSVCRIGDEKFVKVSISKTKHALLMGMSSFRGEIYGIFVQGPRYEFVTIHLVGETTRTVEFRPLLINDRQYWGYRQLWRGWEIPKASFMIESPCGSPGELLLVTKIYSGVVEFRVFRVNLNEMKCSAELDNIDGMTIFVGHWGNGFCCISETARSKPNSIYYTEETGRAVYVYDLDDRSSTLLMPCPAAHPYMSTNYWVDPSVERYAIDSTKFSFQ